MIPFQPYLIGGAVLVAFVAGWKVNGWRHGAEYVAQMEGARIASEAVAKEIAKIDVRNVTIRQEVQKHVIEKPVYRECLHDPDTLRLLNAAITGQEPGDSKLPGTDPAK
jgi:hypothetical protein